MPNTKLKKYEVHLSSPVVQSFRGIKAGQSLDIDMEKKSEHHLVIEADIETEFNIGLIVGASGSGKTTLGKQIYGENAFKELLQDDKAVIDQFSDNFSYDEIANMLSGVGLTSVPCWIRPAYTLSNGQKARAECALQMANDDNLTIIDEWTSVVDRTVAKVMSHCISKHARKTNKQVVLIACHYDIIEWLNPDWIIDCNTQKFIDRRRLRSSFKKSEELNFTIKPITGESWKYFSKYHYLNDRLVGGINQHYGMFYGDMQIGFISYNNYVPRRRSTKSAQKKYAMHFNRLVIHPDYCGFGLGIKFLNATAKDMVDRGYNVYGKFSSAPMYASLSKSPLWKLKDISKNFKNAIHNENRTIIKYENEKQRKMAFKNSFGRTQNIKYGSGFRHLVTTYSFEYTGNING